jgi:peptide/nickel transport system permease protein
MSTDIAPRTMTPLQRIGDTLRRAIDSDLFYSFRRSPLVVVATLMTIAFILAATFAPWVTPHDPFDPASLELMDAFTPPVWDQQMGDPRYLLGTDDQGRDMLSAIIYGSRISLIVGFAAVVFSIVLGVGIGLIAGFVGGWIDAILMRIADIQLTIPGLLIALMIDGIARTALPSGTREEFALYVVIFAIGISNWPQYARVVRSGTMSEKTRDYVAAARIIGTSSPAILWKHVLPNILGPVLVLGTLGLALAVITEATLSFLGVGVPPTTPSLGTLIRIGNDFLFSGEWWITLFPAMALVLLVLSVNLMGDWLRDALNPKLR